MTAHDRSALGAADVTDERLTATVGRLLGEPAGRLSLLDSRADPVDYDLMALTTAGRWWVCGHVGVEGEPGARPFRMFVKHVQTWERSPIFAFVPEEMREVAARMVPWRTEPLAYRSDLGDRLPDGLRMPRALDVLDLDEGSACVWLEDVSPTHVTWDLPRFADAARLMGRFAASPRVAERALVGGHALTLHDYLHGRLAGQVLPLLRDERVWHHPLVAAAFDQHLRAGLLAAADRAGSLVEELMDLPQLTSHGDACPNNLLVVDGRDGFTLVDYGFLTLGPVGFDLAQLLVGDVQVGRLPASGLADVEAVIVPAYVDGLRAEGCDIAPSVVRRAHAAQLMLFTGLSTLPFELLDAEPTPELHHVAEERAAIARFCLALLDGTDGQDSSRPG